MIRHSDLPDTLPLFPLPGALLLPRARLPLHIFEPRYLAMLEDCLKLPHRLIGMIQPRPHPLSPRAPNPRSPDPRAPNSRAQAGAGDPPLSAIGCAGRLTGFSETEDGRYMVTLTGISRFKLRAEQPGFSPYRRAEVDWTPFARDLGASEDDPGFDRPRFFVLLSRYFQSRQLGTDWSGLREADNELLINAISMLCPFAPEDKQALLEAPSLVTRRETLVTLIEFALAGGPGAGDFPGAGPRGPMN